MKKVYSCIFLLLLFFALGSCKQEKNKAISAYGYLDATTIIKRNITIDEMINIGLPYALQGMQSLHLSMDDVRNIIGVECLRNNKDITYSVHKVLLGDKDIGYGFVYYEEETVRDVWIVKKLPNKKDFKTIIKKHTTIETIKQYDPATILIFDKFSYHRFADGTILEITYSKYDDKIVVEDYNYKNDEIKLIEKMLPTDLNMIL